MVQKKYGWWDDLSDDDYKIRCTNCGGEAPVVQDDDVKYVWQPSDVCPHCGAEMWEAIHQPHDDDGYEYIVLRRKVKSS